MKKITPKVLLCWTMAILSGFGATAQLPEWTSELDKPYTGDWLIKPPPTPAAVFTHNHGKELILSNGLLKRVFRLQPNLSCISFKNMSNGQELIRSCKPEGRLTIDGKELAIGGLYGQKENAYLLPAWVDSLQAEKSDFQYVSFTVSPLQPFLNWKPRAWTAHTARARGILLTLHFRAASDSLRSIEVDVHYELYDNIPMVTKWISVKNHGGRTIKINKAVTEILGIIEEESAVDGSVDEIARQHGLYIETNYAFNNAGTYHLSDHATHWKADSLYTSQVHYRYQTPCLVEVYPGKGPGVTLPSGETYRSIRAQELLIDTYDRERRGLSIRSMYRMLTPWTTSNPIFMHLVSQNDAEVTTAVDQCAATGYEMVILSFGSHCDMEDTSAANIRKWKQLAAYAHSKGIGIGGYSLFSSRHISDSDDVIDPITGKPDSGAIFGAAPCMGSKWGLAYLDKLKYFISRTAFDLLEHDGPYPGDVCASRDHPGHEGLEDSQWKQAELQKELYHWCNEHGVYVNAPDWYIQDGTNKMPLGYREVNFTLSRSQQKILNRQNIYDGLWEKIPSMCWGFVPLTDYHEGGPESVIEPLHEHLADYRQLMMQYYGAGVQACYRGPRLYDTDSTRKAVAQVIAWYKKHRDVLNGDIIHLRRADGKDWDGILHVRSHGKEKAFAMLYNPTSQPVTRSIRLPLYYAGLDRIASVRMEDGPAKTYTLDRTWTITVSATIPANGYTWAVVE